MNPDLGTGLMILGIAILYSCLVGLAFREGFQLSWPEPLVQGQYLVWGPDNAETRYVLRPDWDDIIAFFMTWTVILATPCVFFSLGIVLIKWKLIYSCTFAPIWRLP